MRDLFGGWGLSAFVWVGQVAGQGSPVAWEPATITGVAGILLLFVLRTFERMQTEQRTDRERLVQVIQQNTESNIRMESKMEDVLRAIVDERARH